MTRSHYKKAHFGKHGKAVFSLGSYVHKHQRPPLEINMQVSTKTNGEWQK